MPEEFSEADVADLTTAAQALDGQQARLRRTQLTGRIYAARAGQFLTSMSSNDNGAIIIDTRAPACVSRARRSTSGRCGCTGRACASRPSELRRPPRRAAAPSSHLTHEQQSAIARASGTSPQGAGGARLAAAAVAP